MSLPFHTAYPCKISLIAGDAKRSKISVPKLIRPTARTLAYGETVNIMWNQLRPDVRAMDRPEWFTYRFDDRFCRTRPNLKVWLWDGTIEMHDIKFRTKRHDPELKRRLDAIEIAYAEIGIVYRRFFSDDFDHQRSNIDLVFRYRGYPGAETFLAAATEVVRARPGLTFAALAAVTGIDMPSFLALVFDNRFGIDLDAPIGPSMVVMP